MPDILPVVSGVLGIIGAFQQQSQASQAAGMSREALELQKRVIDAYLKELEELKPYRHALRQLGATRMTWAPQGWSRWTSDPWRYTADLPPVQTLLSPPPPPSPPGPPQPPSLGNPPREGSR